VRQRICVAAALPICVRDAELVDYKMITKAFDETGTGVARFRSSQIQGKRILMPRGRATWIMVCWFVLS
jgi:hypothetical protein